ncbi:MAG: alpha-amylase, partial [Desulfovibrio sp.]|nr:alpha-amylase [Desulfovibrio sp.]
MTFLLLPGQGTCCFTSLHCEEFMASVCFFFSIHEPFMLRHYNVFDLGQNSIYEDDERNYNRIRHLASIAYLPAIDLLLKKVEQAHGEFRFALHASIPALELFEQYTPEVIQGLRALAETKSVEFVAGAAHSLAFLYARDEFARQLANYTQLTETMFGQKPTCFCSTELIYNNDFASFLESMDYKVMLAEGTDHVLGWRSPNFVYRPETGQKICLLLRNRKLSRDLYLRFSDRSWDKWPLTADSYAA